MRALVFQKYWSVAGNRFQVEKVLMLNLLTQGNQPGSDQRIRQGFTDVQSPERVTVPSHHTLERLKHRLKYRVAAHHGQVAFSLHRL
jgi:hypothetical protein